MLAITLTDGDGTMVTYQTLEAAQTGPLVQMLSPPSTLTWKKHANIIIIHTLLYISVCAYAYMHASVHACVLDRVCMYECDTYMCVFE